MQSDPTGDPGRQAVASLRGYAYQIVNGALAWIRLGSKDRLYLEVAEDYASVASLALTAFQVKDTEGSGRVTLNTESVKEAISSFVDLVAKNPHHSVHLHYLTTSQITRERDASQRPYGEAALAYWRKAAGGADLKPLREILEMNFPAHVREFVRSRDDDQLRKDLFQRIWWDCGAPDIAKMEAHLEEEVICLLDRLSIPPSEAERLCGSILYDTLRKSTFADRSARVLTKSDLHKLIHSKTQVSISRQAFDEMINRPTQLIWGLVRHVIKRIAQAGRSLPANMDPLGSADEKSSLEICFKQLWTRIQNEKTVDARWMQAILGSDEANDIFELLISTPHPHEAASLLFELAEQAEINSHQSPSTVITATDQVDESSISEEIIRQAKADVKEIEDRHRHFLKMHNALMEDINKTLNAHSAREVLRIALALQQELRLDQKFAERTLCVDTDILIHYSSTSRNFPEERKLPSSAFAFYLLKEPPPIALAITAPHFSEVKAVMLSMWRHERLAPSLDRLNSLLRACRIRVLPDPALMLPAFAEMSDHRHKILTQFRGYPSHSEAKNVDATAIVHLLLMNKDSELTRTISTLATTTERLIHLSDAEIQGGERGSEQFVKYSAVIQDVYGPAFSGFAHRSGLTGDKSYLEFLASTVIETKAVVLQAVRENTTGRRTTSSEDLKHLRRAMDKLGTILDPFHERVAKTLDAERKNRLNELDRWIADIQTGRRKIDKVILDSLAWIDAVSSSSD